VGLVAVSVAIALYGGTRDKRPAPPTLAEMAWVGRFEVWFDGVIERPLEQCRGSLDLVGAPPTVRLAAEKRLAQRICRGFEVSQEATREGQFNRALRASDVGNRVREKLRPLFARYRAGVWRRVPRKGGRTGESRVEPLFSKLVAKLSGRRASVRCWSRHDWPKVLAEKAAYEGGAVDKTLLGFTLVAPVYSVNLSPDSCRELADFAYRSAVPRSRNEQSELADALETIAHESVHIAPLVPGYPNQEAEAECIGMQRISRAAVALGAYRLLGDELAQLYWSELYPRDNLEYLSPDCKPGGALDQRPQGASVWP
jgi:hypothetical protein